HCLAENERKTTLLEVFEMFESFNTKWKRTQCFVMDKDFFSGGEDFAVPVHVQKYLKHEISQEKYGFSVHTKQQL
ncbi:TPA: hypothetical protein N0F65_012059, partial [Lagenidium giganteum]